MDTNGDAAQIELTAGGQRKCVLILSSEGAVVRVLSQVLENRGYRIADSSEVTSLFSSDQRLCAMILLDADLPGTDMAGLVKRFRRHPATEHVPLVVMGSREKRDILSDSLRAGAHEAFLKPIDPFLFVRRINPLLGHERRERDADKTHHILVVDDDDRALVLVASALHERGSFEVSLAKGIDDAVRRVAQVHPDIAMVPCHLGDTTGRALLGRMRLVPGLQSLVGLIAADENEMSDAQMMLSDAIKAVIPKPYHPLNVAREIEQAIGIDHADAPPRPPSDRISNEIRRILDMRHS